jgi:hypothetical protein
MLIVSLALVAVIVLLATVFAGALGRMQHAHARREDLLVNQILHLSGRTWTPPPADEWAAPADGEPLVREYDWTTQPEQQPYV